MSTEPVVWRADPDEARTVAHLLVEFRDWCGSDWPSANAFLASVERLIEQPDTEFLLGAVDGDSPPSAVCQLRCRLSVWMAADDCWLEDLYVAEAGRRRGVGRALVEAALERARARGARRIELDTNETNSQALGLYEEMGVSTTSKGGATGLNLFLGRRLD